MLSKKFQKNPGKLNDFVEIIKSHKPKSVLDVGCGIGFLVRRLRDEGLEVKGIDFAKDLPIHFWSGDKDFMLADAGNLPFEDDSFDLVFSSDFFEHLPEGRINKVADEMNRVGKTVIARIAYKDLLRNQQCKYHVTNKAETWWRTKLMGRVEII